MNCFLYFSGKYFEKSTSDCSQYLSSITSYIFFQVYLVSVAISGTIRAFSSATSERISISIFHWIHRFLISLPSYFEIKRHQQASVLSYQPNNCLEGHVSQKKLKTYKTGFLSIALDWHYIFHFPSRFKISNYSNGQILPLAGLLFIYLNLTVAFFMEVLDDTIFL